jgi:ActR/RegA family two-component response regulator
MAAQTPPPSRGEVTTERDAEPTSPTSSGGVASTPKCEVLLVGDERCTARLFESWIAEQFPTRAVSTTERALKEVTTTPVNVVVVDDQWLRDSGGDLLRQLRRADEPCRTLLLLESDSGAGHADHRVQLPADGQTVCDAIDTARQTGEYERTIERLVSLVDQRRVFERDEGRTEAECRQVQQRIESLNAHLDDTLGDVEHRYVELIGHPQRRPPTEATR